MCIALFCFDHPVYSVILCSNRDEFLHRATTHARFHNFEIKIPGDDDEATPEKPGDVLSGRDLVAGGTWLGINRKGRIAVLTNITEEYQTWPTSRGDLPHNFLNPPANKFETLDDYVRHLTTPPSDSYAGFNLLLAAPSKGGIDNFEVTRLTNSGGGGPITARSLRDNERAHGGMSNGVDGAAEGEWRKVIEGSEKLQKILEVGLDEDGMIQATFDALSICRTPPQTRQQLRTSIMIPPLLIPITGKVPPGGNEPPVPDPVTKEIGLWYATRLSTVLLVKKTGEVTFVERDIWALDPDTQQPVHCGTNKDRITRFQLEVI
ncbi:DUF833-domain-containing protein [Dacryopinax primogenitus]|uniref:DUF833-domain-containing protein n=1 Tax=Dacryopinax primogenitus (strain DJM 731) TaxID=1858805 RepID=M5G3Q9_DACPD|nr:DUF833-domain-containing protein [Dacryopinax primogenitus]EJU03309.1 DUF833-domain-containing protein [Dacryopinax primogenitus]